MFSVTLNEILTAREERARLQRSLLNMYSFPVVSFTMNIAGPVKSSPLIRRAFKEGEASLCEALGGKSIAHKSTLYKKTGCELVMSVDSDARELKQLCVKIEQNHPIGRLFDMDVIQNDGKPLSRGFERGCIVCGAPGRGCAAGRIHSADEVMEISRRMMTDYFLKKDAARLACIAHKSLVKEVKTTPKPGLVDCRNNGSHTDMSIDTFLLSSRALTSYFAKCFEICASKGASDITEVFTHLKKAGLDAEEAMYTATGGVNTHKGIIYSMGILCASLGRLWTPEMPFSKTDDVLKTAAQFARIFRADSSSRSAQLCRRYGIGSVTDEALSGFASVRTLALPRYTELTESGCDENLAGAYTLLHLIANVDDTNLYHRGGEQGALWAKQRTKELLKSSPRPSTEEIIRLDRQFIERNLSPGGCADLLAITYFLFDIQSEDTKY